MSAKKGIADEPHFDALVAEIGGKRVTSIIPHPATENADYYFEKANVIVELKILEKEFGQSDDYNKKLHGLIEIHVRERGMRGPLLGQPFSQEFVQDMIELFRPPLARMAKKANRQIKETKALLGTPDAKGVLLCVNDNFRSLEPRFIMNLMTRILIGGNSSIDAFIYHTNHYVDVPGIPFANLLWTPVYAPGSPETLVEFVNDFGRRWFDFVERESGPFDHRQELPDEAGFDAIMLESKAIKPRRKDLPGGAD